MTNRPLPEVDSINQAYWDAAGRGEFVLPKCNACGSFFFPPRSWCPKCYSKNVGWCPASGEGKIASYSKVYISSFESYVAEFPYVLATVKLAEGPQLMANIVNCDPEQLRIGGPVRVTFEMRAEGVMVPQFEPAR